MKPTTATAKPVAATPVVTKAVAPKPKPAATRPTTPPFVANVKPVAAPVPVTAVALPVPVAKPLETKAAPTAPVADPIKETIMNDTIANVQDTFKNTTEDATAKATAFFNDANGRAKDALTKGTKAVEELVEFSKGNLEAFVASGRVAAKGAEEIAKYSAEYGRTSIEKANATAKQFAAVKSPTEFFQLQGDVAKQALDAVVAEGSRFTESYLKLLGEMVQPIQNRVAVAVEKVKTSVSV